MAIKLATERDKVIPPVVKAVVATRSSMLEHKLAAEFQNKSKIEEAGKLMHRSHKEQI